MLAKMRRLSRRRPFYGVRAGVVGLCLAALASLSVVSAGATATSPGDPTASAYVATSVRAATWNICGEAGGATPVDLGYCPDRNRPDVKADAIADVVRQRDLNAVLLQEVCSGNADDGSGNSSSDPANPSDLEWIASRLGPEWTFRWATVVRPDGRSDCRGGLSGTLSVAIGVKGTITWSHAVPLPVPLGEGADRAQVLCVGVADWDSHVCTTHLANIDDPSVYAAEVETVRSEVAGYPSVVLGGDFNTGIPDNLQALYGTLAECDQQSYLPGDANNEATHFTYTPGAPYTGRKIDYLFSTSGFTGCDSWTEKADQADYSTQPSCSPTATPVLCVPTGISDHAPLYGYTKGGPVLDWGLADGTGDTASDGSGNSPGALSGGAVWSMDHAGSLLLDGRDGAVTAPGPALDTSRSFTVSAWAKVDPSAGTSVVLSQDGAKASGVMLWYNQPDDTWRFGMQRSDATGWNVDQAVSTQPARTGTWTRLAGVFDAAHGTLTLYVDGVAAGSAVHTTRWSATGPFVAGRDRVSGAPNAFWKGALQSVRAFDYPMTAAEVASFASETTAPTGNRTVPDTGSSDPGCTAFAPYGTVPSTTPALTVQTVAADPSAAARGEFSIWDDTDPDLPQPVVMGGPGSASGWVTGGGEVSVTTPPLVPGHLYGWHARTNTASGISATGPVCHFYAAAG